MRLNELEDNKTDEAFAQRIQQDCQPYLKMVEQTGCVLVRGML